MIEIIKKILKEEKVESKKNRFIEFVINDFLKDSKIFDIRIPFNTTNELRDLGWEDEMFDFVYGEYENFGFRQDLEDEDLYFFKDSDEEWDLDQMVQEMFYIFIDEKVKTGEFVEVEDGWEINQNMWSIETKNNGIYQVDWSCSRETYMHYYETYRMEDVLVRKYGVRTDMLSSVTNKIMVIMENMLEKKDKFC